MRALEDGNFDRCMRSNIASTSYEGSWVLHGTVARRPPYARPPPRSSYGAKVVEFPSKNAREGKKNRGGKEDPNPTVPHEMKGSEVATAYLAV